MAKVLYGWSKDDIHQGLLEQVVRSLFAGEDVSTNVRKGASIKSPSTGNYLELDVGVPKLNICFEFQDPYHYITTWDSQTPLSLIKQNDHAKRAATLSRGDTLVAVPCWWDGKEQSLVGTILTHRPDLSSALAQVLKADWPQPLVLPIPLNPPRFFFGGGKIPDVGELMLASFPISVHFASSISFESFWWMGEKYDGVRFCWNPRRGTVFSRAGLVIELPPPFYAHITKKMYLDGELWFGRGAFQDSQRLIVPDEIPVVWESLRLLAFDDPTPAAVDHPFEKRYTSILSFVAADSPSIMVAPRVKCIKKAQLSRMAQGIISDGGEGVVLRQPKSIYEHGRSTFLLKIKATRGDKEALVVSVNPTDTELRLPDGTTFTVPAQKGLGKLKKGDVVTFVYTAFSKNSLPTHSRILRIRHDMSWEDVLHDYEVQVTQELSLNETSRNLVEEKRSNKPRDVWLSDKEKTMRGILEGYAKSNNIDPLVPDNWYDVKHQIIAKIQGGRAILQHYEGNYIDALIDLFPNIGLDRSRFKSVPRNFWADLENRREFFRAFAKHEKFDPLIPKNWYKLNVNRFQVFKGGYGILRYYNGDWTKAVIHAFPDIGLNRAKLVYTPRTLWQVADRLKAFTSFARSKGFDPNIAHNWHTISTPEITADKELKAMIDQHYEGNIRNALMHVFPNFDKMSFSRKYWRDKKNQRAVFEAIARSKGFDPLIPSNWYSLKYDTVISFKGVTNVLSNYNGNISTALIELFPNIGLDVERFDKVPRTFFLLFHSHQRFFINFATVQKFDPLVAENWYKRTKEEIAAVKGGGNILKMYEHSLPKALEHVFPDVQFNPSSFFSAHNDEYLTSAAKRRDFLETFAKDKGFNPLNATFWYSVSLSAVLKKGGRSVMSVYDGSLPSALKSLFPEVSFDRSKFVRLSRRHFWCDLENQRKFFREFARVKGFLANTPHHWYSIQPDELTKVMGGKAILRHYGGNIQKALILAFPNIGLHESYFSSPPPEQRDIRARRAIFEVFANHHHFDPLEPSHWYGFSARDMWTMKGARQTVDFYGGNLANALVALFPDIKFNLSLFVDS